MSAPVGSQAPRPFKAWPTDTFFVDDKDIYFNGEGVELVHVPAAHTDGDVMVWFRKSDVVVAGDLVHHDHVPGDRSAAWRQSQGIIAGLNRIIDITIPRDKQEGGTYVIPGHGRLTDEADVVDYRDMVTIIRDRFQDAIKKGMTLEQVKAARLAARLRGPVRRSERILDDGRVHRGGLQEPESGAPDVAGRQAGGGRAGRPTMKRPCLLCPALKSAAVAIALTLTTLSAQTPQGGEPQQGSCQAAAPIDLTGYWVVDRERRLAMAHGDAAQRRLCERAAQRRRSKARRQLDSGEGRPLRGLSARPASCACRRACTSPGRTTPR